MVSASEQKLLSNVASGTVVDEATEREEYIVAGYLPQNRGNRSTNRVGAAVSRRLRTADWNISPTNLKYKADGMFVTGNGDSVTVLVDFGIKSKNRDVAEGVAATVCTWAQV